MKEEKVSLCENCGCMTKTIYSVTKGGQCGKCGKVKDQEEKVKWSDEFDKKFGVENDTFVNPGKQWFTIEDIKSFISHLLIFSRREVIEEIERELPKEKKCSCPRRCVEDKEFHEKIGFNDCLSQVKQILSKKEK